MTLRDGFLDHRFTNRSHRIGSVILGELFDRKHDLRQRRQCVTPQRHGCRAGMAGKSDDRSIVPDDTLAAIDHTDGLVFRLEDRALFDVQFDERAQLELADRLGAAITDAVERLSHADALGIDARENIVGGEIAGVNRRGHHRRLEARALRWSS